jgi:hypothetical protein
MGKKREKKDVDQQNKKKYSIAREQFTLTTVSFRDLDLR